MIPFDIALYASYRSNSCALTWQFLARGIFICTLSCKMDVSRARLFHGRCKQMLLFIHIGIDGPLMSCRSPLKSPQVTENEHFGGGLQLISGPLSDFLTLFLASAPVSVTVTGEKAALWLRGYAVLWPLSSSFTALVCRERGVQRCSRSWLTAASRRRPAALAPHLRVCLNCHEWILTFRDRDELWRLACEKK